MSSVTAMATGVAMTAEAAMDAAEATRMFAPSSSPGIAASSRGSLPVDFNDLIAQSVPNESLEAAEVRSIVLSSGTTASVSDSRSVGLNEVFAKSITTDSSEKKSK